MSEITGAMNVLADANAGMICPSAVATASEQLTAALLADDSLPLPVRLLLELREVEAGFINHERIAGLIGEAAKRH